MSDVDAEHLAEDADVPIEAVDPRSGRPDHDDQDRDDHLARDSGAPRDEVTDEPIGRSASPPPPPD